MPLTLPQHLELIEDEFATARAAPLSLRKALLVAALLDNFCDRVFAAQRGEADKVFLAEDLPAYRRRLRELVPALGPVFDVCALPPDGPTLKVVAVEVPIAEYHKLRVEDFMVSLYNRHTVQRVVIAAPDGSQVLAHEVLAAAIDWWRQSGLVI